MQPVAYGCILNLLMKTGHTSDDFLFIFYLSYLKRLYFHLKKASWNTLLFGTILFYYSVSRNHDVYQNGFQFSTWSAGLY